MPPKIPEILVITDSKSRADKLRGRMDKWNDHNQPHIHLEFARSVKEGRRQHISENKFDAVIYDYHLKPNHLPQGNMVAEEDAFLICVPSQQNGWDTLSSINLWESLVDLVRGKYK